MKPPSVRLFAYLFGVGLLLSAAVATGDEFDSTRMEIREVMTYHHIPSVTVAVAQKGKIIWEEGFGWANVARHIPATAHTTYSLASISKPVTATALMILVERGAIDLSKPLDDYLGAQKLVARVGRASDATVRRVADHTAGLPMHALWLYEDEHMPRPSMDETIRRYGVLVNPPGEAFTYSNLDYGLLEYAIERVSGESYARFVRDEIFTPLRLTESAVNHTPDLGDKVAARYWGDHIVPFFDFDSRGAAAVFMSAHDLVRFGLFHLQGRLADQQRVVLQPGTIASMRDAATLNNGKKNDEYGVGWEMGERHGLKWFGHGGGMAGVAGILSVYPEAGLVVVVLGNGVSQVGAVHGLENVIVHTVLPETIRNDHGFRPKGELVGLWKGMVDTYTGQTPVEIDIHSDGRVFSRLGPAASQEIVSISLDPDTSLLSLDNIRGELGTPDASHYPSKLQFSLKLRSPDTLSGSVCANSMESLPDRMGNALSYWTELHKGTIPETRNATGNQ